MKFQILMLVQYNTQTQKWKEERPCKKHGTAALRIHHYTHKQKMNTMMVCDWDLQFNKYNIYINIYIIS